MAKNIELTRKLYNALVKSADARNKNFNVKGKKARDLKAEFITGAMRAIDIINGTDKSCITPHIMFTVMRGDELKELPENNS